MAIAVACVGYGIVNRGGAVSHPVLTVGERLPASANAPGAGLVPLL